MHKLINSMLSDLSCITGIEEQKLLDNYISLNRFNAIREMLIEEGNYIKEKGLALIMWEKFLSLNSVQREENFER